MAKGWQRGILLELEETMPMQGGGNERKREGGGVKGYLGLVCL